MIIIPLHHIHPNPWQTRQRVDKTQVAELAADIVSRKAARPETRGLLQLPAGRPIDAAGNPLNAWMPGAHVQLVYGHNRLAAFHLLSENDEDYLYLPVEIVQFDDQEMATAAWAENAQRSDLTPIEEAEAIQRMIEAFGWTQAQAGDHLGLSRPTVSNKLRLLKLDDAGRQAVLEGQITERQAMAILPVFDLPAPAFERAKNKDGWLKTDDLVQWALEGQSSDYLRGRADVLVRYSTKHLDRDNKHDDPPFPLDHLFEELPLVNEVASGGIQSPRCDNCPIRVKYGQFYRCPDFDCYDAKAATWIAARLAEASAILGISVADDDESTAWEVEKGFGDEDLDLVSEIVIEDGCKRGCLRLRFNRSDYAYHPAGFDDIAVVCHHGKDANRCHCLAAKKGQQTREETFRESRDRLAKEIEKKIKNPVAGLLSTSLASNHRGAWIVLLRAMAIGYKKDDIKEWTLQQIQDKIAHRMIWNLMGYYSTFEAAQTDVSKILADAGLPAPWQCDTAADILQTKLERIAGWFATEELPTSEAVQGNIDNLEKLADQLEDLDGDHAGLAEAIAALRNELEELRTELQIDLFEGHLED